MTSAWTRLRKRREEATALWRRFGHLVLAERRLLAFAAAATAAEAGFALLVPFPVKYLFDGLLAPDHRARLLFGAGDLAAQHPVRFLACIAAAMIAFPALSGVSAYYATVWSASAGQRMVTKLRKELYTHLHRLSLGFHRRSRLGDLLLRLTGDIPMLRDVLSESLIELLGRIVSIAATLALLLALDWRLTLVAAVVLGGVALLSMVHTRRIARVSKLQRRKEGVLAQTASESLTTLAQIKVLGREREVSERFARQNRTSLRKGLVATRLQAMLERWVELVFAAGTAIVTAAGALLVIGGHGMSPGDLLVFVALARNLNKPLRKIARISGRIGKAAACGERVVEILHVEPEEVDPPDAVDAPALCGSLVFDGVGFDYGDGTPVLEHVDLTVAAGERVALVGSNGAGKTTLLHLLLRLYRPTRGSIRIDGRSIDRLRLKSLRDQFAVALQGTYLFGASVRENLLFSCEEADDRRMFEALRLVGADFVSRGLAGLDLELAEHGANLSGGERRKLALAATFLRRTPILILDEPTTHVDGRSRDDIVRCLPELCRGRTALIVTHDPELLRSVDRVVWLEGGRIADCGSHAELQARSPGYAALFSTPAAGLRRRAS